MSTPTRGRHASLFLAAAIAFVPALGHAQSVIKPGEETLLFRVGALSQQFDTFARIDGSNSIGSGIDLEGEAGLGSDKSTYMLAGTLRFAKNHRLDGLYDENKRSASRATERSLSIGDTVIPAGTVLRVEQRTAIGYIGYRYSFMKTPDMEVAAGIGSYGGNFKLKFDANSPVVSIDKSTTLPLPVLVLTGDFYLTDRMTLTAGVRGLKVKIGDVDGSALHFGVAGEYFLTRNLGVGASLERFDIEADVTKSGFRGNAELKTNSGKVYLTLRF